jgi:hypothetical protein
VLNIKNDTQYPKRGDVEAAVVDVMVIIRINLNLAALRLAACGLRGVRAYVVVEVDSR